MNRISFRAVAAAGATALAAAGILGGTLVFAQDSSSDAQKATYLEALAANLGVDADALKAAIQDTNTEVIDQWEADGTITADEAARLRERVADDTAEGDATLGIWRSPGGHGHGGHFGLHLEGEALASFFGITEDELRAELASGSTLAEAAEAHGKTRDELKAFLTAAQEVRLAEKVAAGDLTQAEANGKLAAFSADLDERIDSSGGPRGFGPGRSGPGNATDEAN